MTLKSMMPSLFGRSTPSTGTAMEPYRALQTEMERVFNDFFSDWPSLRQASSTALPRLDVAETPDAVTVTAELPGLEQKDVELELDEQHLTIRGQRKSEHEEKKADYWVKECSYGSYFRQVPLGFAAESDKVNASMKNGVLTVVVPKTAAAKERAKKIEIKPAA